MNLSVGSLVGRSVYWSVCHDFLKVREVTLACAPIGVLTFLIVLYEALLYLMMVFEPWKSLEWKECKPIIPPSLLSFLPSSYLLPSLPPFSLLTTLPPFLSRPGRPCPSHHPYNYNGYSHPMGLGIVVGSRGQEGGQLISPGLGPRGGGGTRWVFLDECVSAKPFENSFG